jgi:hypothetical protein
VSLIHGENDGGFGSMTTAPSGRVSMPNMPKITAWAAAEESVLALFDLVGDEGISPVGDTVRPPEHPPQEILRLGRVVRPVKALGDLRDERRADASSAVVDVDLVVGGVLLGHAVQSVVRQKFALVQMAR